MLPCRDLFFETESDSFDNLMDLKKNKNYLVFHTVHIHIIYYTCDMGHGFKKRKFRDLPLQFDFIIQHFILIFLLNPKKDPIYKRDIGSIDFKSKFQGIDSV